MPFLLDKRHIVPYYNLYRLYFAKEKQKMQENFAEQTQSQNILKREVDYNHFYKKWYKKIPKILAIIGTIPFLLLFVISLIVGIRTDDPYWVPFLFLSIPFGVLNALVAYFFSAVILSQKIMVVNELKEINDKLTRDEFDGDEKE